MVEMLLGTAQMMTGGVAGIVFLTAGHRLLAVGFLAIGLAGASGAAGEGLVGAVFSLFGLSLLALALYRWSSNSAQANRQVDAARRRAEADNHRKTAFLAGMSHELRTPLNAIIGFSEVLSNQTFGPIGHAKYLEYSQDINSSGRHLLELINDLLDTSKIEAGRMELHEEHLDVVKLIHAVERLVWGRAERAGVRLVAVTPNDLPQLMADPLRLRQMLVNLLSNAIKFTPSGGTVCIEARLDDGGDLLLAVTDTGVGMRGQDIEKAMSPFSQVDDDPERRAEGTGLGLPLTRMLAELHGGSLTLESERGVGTVASIRLPAARLRRLKPQPHGGLQQVASLGAAC